MPATPEATTPSAASPLLSNAEIAHRLAHLAQLLSAQGENPFKVKAYRRAAETLTALPTSIAAMVRDGDDLTSLPGIGKGIASALTEIVQSGSLRQLDTLRATVAPEVAALGEYPRLDAKRVQQAYAKLGISSVEELKQKLTSGELGRALGPRAEQHFRRALIASHEILLYDAHDLADSVQSHLLALPGVKRVEPAGEFRRRVEVVGELTFLIEADDFAAVVAAVGEFGGRTEQVRADATSATFKLPAGILLHLIRGTRADWGRELVRATGSEEHVHALEQRGLDRLDSATKPLTTERAVYQQLGLAVVPPELRAGLDEVELAAAKKLPVLITRDDLHGDLHAHTTSSDGAHTIEEMAAAARERGYTYLGITDHSQSLKIAGGLSEEALWNQIRRIDRLNAKLRGFHLLKSAEVDIHADGKLDYPDALLAELDYTVCSIHSRFALNREQQTERILRAMDNPHFTILGHATGRLLLRRPGYEIDIERVIAHARERGCFFEINSSPDRLDLSVAHARLARAAGIRIAICTDAHSATELDFITGGLEQARRAGLTRADVLNALTWPELKQAIARGP